MYFRPFPFFILFWVTAVRSVSEPTRDEAVKAAEQYAEKLAMIEKGAANGTGVQTGKVAQLNTGIRSDSRSPGSSLWSVPMKSILVYVGFECSTAQRSRLLVNTTMACRCGEY